MRTKFLNFLVDPKNGEKLKLVVLRKVGEDVVEGSLISSKNKYPIVKGVPRFSGYDSKDNYAHSFGFEWNKWADIQFESNNKGKVMEGHTLKMWEKIVISKSKKVKGSLIIDFGCGSGRFIEISCMKGAKVIGLDMSSAVDVAYEKFKDDSNVLIVQGDILNPPFTEGVADGAYSIGVLHHTAGPRVGFNKITKCIKSGGWLAVSVYGEIGHYTDVVVNLYRNIFKFLWNFFGPYPPLIYSYFCGYVLWSMLRIPIIKYFAFAIKMFVPFIALPDRQWAILDTFDSVTPSNQTGHSVYEVYSWFKNSDYKVIEPSNWGGTSLWGIKK